MVQLQTLGANASREDILGAMDRDGACIVEGKLDPALRSRFIDEVMPYVEATRYGGDEFSGRQTRRTGALIARCPASREIVMDEAVLAAAEAFLAPYAERIQLHLTQTIFIGPGNGAQTFHRDRQAWGKHIPRDMEPQFNTIWALSDFTAENGATRVAPGSHRWEPGRQPEADEVCQAEMRAGSVLLYSGSVIHSGGENQTNDVRMGLNITYCLGWLRQEENQFLSCPPEVARDLDPGLQALLGYTMGNYALGYYSIPFPAPGESAGIQPPERAVGSKPVAELSITNETE